MRQINSIILHCTATRIGQSITMQDIYRWHVKERGFSDIGYHFVVFPDGSIKEGRNIQTVGAHCIGHNSTSIGIAYVGGLDADGNPTDTRTQAQRQSLVKLVLDLSSKYKVNYYEIHCHNEFAKKACPCFQIQDFRYELADALNNNFFSMLKREVFDNK